MADTEVHVFRSFTLQAGQKPDGLAQQSHLVGIEPARFPAVGDGIEELRVAQVVLEVAGQVLAGGMDMRNGQPLLLEMAGHIDKCLVLVDGSAAHADKGRVASQAVIASV